MPFQYGFNPGYRCPSHCVPEVACNNQVDEVIAGFDIVSFAGGRTDIQVDSSPGFTLFFMQLQPGEGTVLGLIP
jgi:hypothetical protein